MYSMFNVYCRSYQLNVPKQGAKKNGGLGVYMIESEGYEFDASAYSEATYRYDADDEFTSPTEWNPSINDDHRASEEMIRQFPVVPHEAINEFYDHKDNINHEYLRGHYDEESMRRSYQD